MPELSLEGGICVPITCRSTWVLSIAFQTGTAMSKSYMLRHPQDQHVAVRTCPRATAQRGDFSEPVSGARRAFLRQLITTLTLPAVTPASAASYFDKYDRYASYYETLDGTTFLPDILGFSALRQNMLAQARGNVLEVGIGTGVNLPLYNYECVSSITGLDFSGQMLGLAKKKVEEIDHGTAEISVLQGRAEDLQLADNAFDTVVDTFSLCVFPKPMQALQEMMRVLKRSSDARVLLLEHSLSTNPVLAAYQNLTAEPTAALSKGCYPNQDVSSMVRRAGFSVLNQKSFLAGTIVCLELSV